MRQRLGPFDKLLVQHLLVRPSALLRTALGSPSSAK